MAVGKANGEGSLYYDRNAGRWAAAVTVGRDRDGRPVRRKRTARTRKEALALLRDAVAALDDGLDVPDNRATVAEFAAYWTAHVLPGEGLAPKTEAWYPDILARYVLPTVGRRTLTGPRALRVEHVEAMTAGLLRAGHSRATALGARTALSKLLQAAVVRGRVARNVARLAKVPGDGGRARPVKAFTVAELRDLYAATAGTRWHPLVIVAATTGLRPGELLGLEWAAVQLTRQGPHVSVRRSMSHTPGGHAVAKAPKRERSYRTVPLVPLAVAALSAWRKDQAAERLRAGDLWSSDWPDLVFTTEQGVPVRVDSFRRALTARMPGAHPHRLRHTYASHLIERGVPIRHVAELLGDSVATVEASYAHVLRPKFEVVDALDDLAHA